ncbi:MAG: hypothetical protein PQJ61_03005 [Spirochaetales bacterium]|uniref:Uncharacterized protein n=1 Tax=Candidatus Thalassospirochaeta sargassi TaxID=3119039 RepID=A0AAJ1IE47_9SPIO|nr:hypothetical protein [Spirochaetales bacterium]
MTKLEIIANQALESQLMEIMPQNNGKPCYTMLKQVDGSGYSGFCLGNDVWPEENVMFILYLDDDRLETLKQKIKGIRERFPRLGLAAFEHAGIIEL